MKLTTPISPDWIGKRIRHIPSGYIGTINRFTHLLLNDRKSVKVSFGVLWDKTPRPPRTNRLDDYEFLSKNQELREQHADKFL